MYNHYAQNKVDYSSFTRIVQVRKNMLFALLFLHCKTTYTHNFECE